MYDDDGVARAHEHAEPEPDRQTAPILQHGQHREDRREPDVAKTDDIVKIERPRRGRWRETEKAGGLMRHQQEAKTDNQKHDCRQRRQKSECAAEPDVGHGFTRYH